MRVFRSMRSGLLLRILRAVGLVAVSGIAVLFVRAACHVLALEYDTIIKSFNCILLCLLIYVKTALFGCIMDIICLQFSTRDR